VIGVLEPAVVLRAGSEFPKEAGQVSLPHEKHPQGIAVRAAVRAEEAALEAAQNLARPRVDLSLRYGRLDPVGSSPARAVSAGEYGTLGVSTDFPFGAPRDRARARYQAALLAEARIEAQRVTRELALARRRAAEDLKLAAVQLEVAEQALDLARQSARDELRKLRAGLSTVIATSVARERALAARLQLVDARAQLAKSAASWIHATGAPWRDQEAKP
jgi:outer membrane protein TolC